MPEEIDAVIIIEILGRPAEHVKEAINGIVEKMGNERDVAILNKEVHEPRTAESSANLFVSFAEIELRFTSLLRLLEICFAYMPSSIEITRPPELRIRLNDANAILNFLLSRLHQYDAIAKKLTVDNMIMQKKLKEMGIKEIDAGKEAKKGKNLHNKKPKKSKKHKK